MSNEVICTTWLLHHVRKKILFLLTSNVFCYTLGPWLLFQLVPFQHIEIQKCILAVYIYMYVFSFHFGFWQFLVSYTYVGTWIINTYTYGLTNQAFTVKHILERKRESNFWAKIRIVLKLLVERNIDNNS